MTSTTVLLPDELDPMVIAVARQYTTVTTLTDPGGHRMVLSQS